MSVSIQVADRDLNKSDVNFKIDPATTLAAAQTLVANAIAALDPITNGLIYGWSISLGAEETDPAVVAVEASDVQRKGQFKFTSDIGTPMRIEVPSIDNTKVVDFSNIISNADADVAAFITFYLANALTNSGAGASQFNGAEKIHRKSSRG